MLLLCFKNFMLSCFHAFMLSASMLSSHMTSFIFHAFLLCLVLGSVIMITKILFITFNLLRRPRGAFMPLRLAFDPDTWNRAAQHSQFLAGPGVDFRIQTTICLFLNNRDFFVFSSTCIVTYLDKSEVALSATAIRLQVSRQLDSYEVPTPPLAD